MAVVDRPPFTRDAWTHVLFTFSNLNSPEDSTATLYLDGRPQGSIKRPQTFSWEQPDVAIMLGLNLVVLLFLIPPFTPLFPFVFYAANGYLLGREYFELVASRRLEPADVRAFRQSHRTRLFLAGLVIAFLLTIPVVNLLVPVIGVAAFTHLFHRMKLA